MSSPQEPQPQPEQQQELIPPAIIEDKPEASALIQSVSRSVNPRDGIEALMAEQVAMAGYYQRVALQQFEPDTLGDPHWCKFQAQATRMSGQVQSAFLRYRALLDKAEQNQKKEQEKEEKKKKEDEDQRTAHGSKSRQNGKSSSKQNGKTKSKSITGMEISPTLQYYLDTEECPPKGVLTDEEWHYFCMTPAKDPDSVFRVPEGYEPPPEDPAEIEAASKNWRDRIALVPDIDSEWPVLLDPCVRVETLLSILDEGAPEETVIFHNPGLTRADLAACRACEAEGLHGPIEPDWRARPSGLPVFDPPPDWYVELRKKRMRQANGEEPPEDG